MQSCRKSVYKWKIERALLSAVSWIFGAKVFSIPIVRRVRNCVYGIFFFHRNFCVMVGGGVRIESLHNIYGSHFCIGHGVCINDNVLLDTSGPLNIGSSVMLSEGCAIYTHKHNLSARVAWKGEAIPLGVTIENNAWIGTRAIILPG